MDEEKTGVDEEKTEGMLEKNAHKIAVGGQVVAALSLLALVPVIRRMRERRRERTVLGIILLLPLIRRLQESRHPKHRRHFPLVGH